MSDSYRNPAGGRHEPPCVCPDGIRELKVMRSWCLESHSVQRVRLRRPNFSLAPIVAPSAAGCGHSGETRAPASPLQIEAAPQPSAAPEAEEWKACSVGECSAPLLAQA